MFESQPSLDHYLRRSADFGLEPRCPFAAVSRCPRYFQSVALMAECGSTKLDPDVAARLKKYWQKTEVWPVVREQETSVISVDGMCRILSNFCPEVTGESWGWFAVGMARYADEIDVDLAHDHLAKTGASPKDWRWTWSSLRGMHYAACPLYSVLAHVRQGATSASAVDEILEVKPGAFGISINLRALVRWVSAKLGRGGKALPPGDG